MEDILKISEFLITAFFYEKKRVFFFFRQMIALQNYEKGVLFHPKTSF